MGGILMLKIMRKIFITLVISSLMIGMTACKNSSTPEVVTKNEPVTVKFLYIWPECKDTMDKTIQMFEEQNKDIKIDASVTPWNEVEKTLQTQFAANDAPDVSFMWPSNIAKYVDEDAALNLSPYLDKDTEWKNSFLSESVVDAGKVKDNVYALAFRGTSTYMGFNQDMFDKYGWKVPNNLEEMETLMGNMLKEGITPIATAAKPDGMQIQSVNNYFLAYEAIKDGLYNDPKYLIGEKTGLINLKATSAERTRGWYQKGYFGKSPFAIGSQEAQNLFFNKNAAMIFFNNNELAAMKKGLGGNFGVFAFPSPAGLKEKVIYGGYDGFFVAKNSKQPEEAVKFLKFLNSKDVQQIWADNEKNLMSLKGINYSDPVLKTMADNGGEIGKYEVSIGFNSGDYTTKCSQAFVEFCMKKEIAPETFAKTVDKALKLALEDAGIK